jgi:hypothetical protein
MSNNDPDDTEEYRGHRRITTDREDIQRWADQRDAAVMPGAESGAAEPSYQFVPRSEAEDHEKHGDRRWDDFFDWFEDEDRAFVYTEDEEGIGHYEILDRDEAAARATLTDEDAEERLLEGETVTTEVTERTVVETEVVETDHLESEVVDRELVTGRIMEAELVDWEVLDTGSDFELRAADDIDGREVTMTGDPERFEYDDVDLGTHLDGYLTAEIEETWRVRRVIEERANVETRIVDTDVEEQGTVESDTVETSVDTEDVQRTIFESDAVSADAEAAGDQLDMIRTERVGDDEFESVLLERQVVGDRIRRRKRFSFENVDSEVLETETADTDLLDTGIIESEGAGTPDVAGSGTTRVADDEVGSDATVGGGIGRTFTDDDEGTTVVDASGDKIGEIDRVDAGTAYVEPKSGLVGSIGSALGWGDDQNEYHLRPEQVRSVDDRGRYVVSHDAESAIEDTDRR